MSEPPPKVNAEYNDHGVLVVREGPSANCSSIGSVVDTLFITSVVGGALFVAVAAAVQREKDKVTVIGEPKASEEEHVTTRSDDAPPP
jgi:hypothetical protein